MRLMAVNKISKLIKDKHSINRYIGRAKFQLVRYVILTFQVTCRLNHVTLRKCIPLTHSTTCQTVYIPKKKLLVLSIHKKGRSVAFMFIFRVHWILAWDIL
jgi:hypothetical protein